MVEVVGEGARSSRTYAVTDAGREEMRRWLIETEPNRAQRNETAVRWFLLGVLEPDDRRVGARARARDAEAYVTNLRGRRRATSTRAGAHPVPPDRRPRPAHQRGDAATGCASSSTPMTARWKRRSRWRWPWPSAGAASSTGPAKRAERAEVRKLLRDVRDVACSHPKER